ncbi:TipC family immunity protein [Streptococcus parasanguinis]|uniref:TipC family immunity protein n=1 Tax=Streptococcus parasanguinis TaxID=1318 RepID=UPI001913F81D|nr:TipC family immunity protein [Streptococcus parasanguinis]MBK5057088.1 TipC family immunity protein [Streptococcus parasanguinis]
MKKHLKKFLWLSPFLLFGLYWVGIYLSLKNPMEEINYSENGGLMRYVMFKPYTETIGNDGIWKENEDFQTYPYSKGIVDANEELSVMMFRGTPNWTYMYDLQLEKGVTLGFIFKYNSSKKLFFQKEVYLSKEDTTYEGQQLLEQLATYGKDRTWLKNQSKKVAEQYILGTWFKNGSSRYSLKNLGDMKIEYNKLIEGQ